MPRETKNKIPSGVLQTIQTLSNTGRPINETMSKINNNIQEMRQQYVPPPPPRKNQCPPKVHQLVNAKGKTKQATTAI
jgi:hypothetical protein